MERGSSRLWLSMQHGFKKNKEENTKRNKLKLKLMKRERKKGGRKQPEFLVDILSTHPCVLFPSGRNKNCLCVFSRPFRKCYRAIIAQLSNSQSLFRLSLLPLPTWAIPLTPPTPPPLHAVCWAALDWAEFDSQMGEGSSCLHVISITLTNIFIWKLFFSLTVNNNNGGGKKPMAIKHPVYLLISALGTHLHETPKALHACSNPAALISWCNTDWKRSLHC